MDERVTMCIEDFCNPQTVCNCCDSIDIVVTQIGLHTFRITVDRLTVTDQTVKPFAPALAIAYWCKMHPELSFVKMQMERDGQNPIFLVTAVPRSID